MVAQKRVRSKPLIRASKTQTLVAASSVTANGATRRQKNHGHTQAYLQQVSALHASGVLTDEEYSAVKQRLLES